MSSSDDDDDDLALWRDNYDGTALRREDETNKIESKLKQADNERKGSKAPTSTISNTSANPNINKGMKRKREPSLPSLVFDLQQVVKRDDGALGYHCQPIVEQKNGDVKLLNQPRFYQREKESKSVKRRRDLEGHNTVDVRLELLLDKAATPLLRKAGWKINNKLTSFKFKLECTNYIIERAQMLSYLEKIQPCLEVHGSSAIDGSSSEPILENMILEQILLARNQRLIEIQSAVESSLVNLEDQPKIALPIFTPDESQPERSKVLIATNLGLTNVQVQKTNQEITSQPKSKSNSFSKSEIPNNNNSTSVKINGSISTNQNSNNDRSNNSDTKSARKSTRQNSNNNNNIRINNNDTKSSRKNSHEECIRFIKITQTIPKYVSIRGNPPKNILDQDAMNLFKETVLKNVKGDSTKKSWNRLLNMKYFDFEDDSFSNAVVIKGRKDLVEKARNILVRSVTSHVTQKNVEDMLNESKNVEFTLKLNLEEDLGITTYRGIQSKIVEKKNNGLQHGGVWFDRAANGQIDQILGDATSKGGVLLGLKGYEDEKWTPILKPNDKKNALKFWREKYDISGEEKDRWIQAYICVNRDSCDSRTAMKDFGQNEFILNVSHRDYTRFGNYKKIARKKDKSIPKKASSQSNMRVEKKVVNDKKQKNENNFRKHFIAKMKEVKRIEGYKSHDIPGRIVNSVMWDAHVEELGERCDNQCICPSMLGKLTKNVIQTFMKEQKKDWKNVSGLKACHSMVGFSTNFCRKFYSKVKRKFPSDSPSQTLQRLIEMWNYHSTQRQFRGVCEDDCICGEYWDAFLPYAENCSFDEEKKLQQEEKQVQIETKASSTSAQNQNGLKDEFTLSINPSKNCFGLFFEDKKGRCVVTSVNPNGYSMSKNINFQVGTIVVAVVKNHKVREDIYQWKDLQRNYNSFKKLEQQIQIIFSRPVNDSNSNDKDMSNEWTGLGGWLGGRSRNGWAGGSTTSENSNNSSNDGYKKLGRNPQNNNMREKIAHQMMKGTKRSVSNSSLVSHQASNHAKSHKINKQSITASSSNSSLVTNQGPDQATKHINRRQYNSAQGNQTHKSILKRSREVGLSQKSNKRVMIDEKRNDFFLIEKRSAALVEKKMEISHERIMDAALLDRNNVETLVKFLKLSPITKDFFEKLSKGIHQQIESLKEVLSLTENQDEYDKVVKEVEQLKMKKGALLIFEGAGEVINMRRYTKEPVLLGFSLIRTKITLSLKGKNSTVKDLLYCSFYVNKQFIKSTSPAYFSRDKSWTMPEIRDFSALFTRSGNTEFYGEDIATIELRKGESDKDSILLGKVSVPLSSIASKVEKNADGVHSYDFLESEFLEIGCCSLKYRKVQATDDMIEEKREEISNRISDLICWIPKFSTQWKQSDEGKATTKNWEQGEKGTTKRPTIIDADISSFGDVTLLHVAVSCRNPDLVRRLVKMGATQRACQTLNTPVAYARKLVREALRDRDGREKYHEIIQILDKSY